MKEITLKLTEEEFEVIDAFLGRGDEEGFLVYEGAGDGDQGEHVLAINRSGGHVFADCITPGFAPVIAGVFNGLLKAK
jgi:hypothetical protein